MNFKLEGIPGRVSVKAKAYGYVREGKICRGVLLGQGELAGNQAQFELEMREDHMVDSSYSLSDLGGLLILGENGETYASGWDEQPVRPERIELPRDLEEENMTPGELAAELSPGPDEEIAEDVLEEEILPEEEPLGEEEISPEEEPLGEEGILPEEESLGEEGISSEEELLGEEEILPEEEPWMGERILPEEESLPGEMIYADSDSQVTTPETLDRRQREAIERRQEQNFQREKQQWEEQEREEEREAEMEGQSAALAQGEFTPFMDQEITDCRKITPADFRILGRRDRGLMNNNFLRYGMRNYGHLLLGRRREDGRYILGVPGVYERQESLMANMFGFPYFKDTGNLRGNGRRFGYWYRLIDAPRF